MYPCFCEVDHDCAPVAQWCANCQRTVIAPGVVFSTPMERQCLVVSEVDDLGNFLALDSDGVECVFGVDLVQTIDAAVVR